MSGVHLVMPMAGHGSRFAKAGFDRPKPLLRLSGQPLFWWATESIRRNVELLSLTFVVLRDHVARFDIERQIMDRYPQAHLVVLKEPTSGALVTAMEGCLDLGSTGPVVFNDCDHAFRARRMGVVLPLLCNGSAGVLCHFRSTNPAYSYAVYNQQGTLVRTAEKQVISSHAIAGAYGFHDRDTFLESAEEYLKACPYDEPFMSGVYNTMVADGADVRGLELDRHVSFGTPDEFAAAEDQMEPFQHWPLTEAVR